MGEDLFKQALWSESRPVRSGALFHFGGAACFLALDEAGLDFRVTKDLDIVN